MNFKEKYQIKKQYLTNNTKRRSGQLISPKVKFIVAHDTGNAKSTAQNNVSYYERTNNEAYASAHIFVDDKDIIECIPAITSEKPEKAWHVRYNVSKDNELYGFEANDVAVGVEYCYGENINAYESYKRYVWIIAYICYKYNLNPNVSIVGHHLLDPGRKFDPASGLKHSGRTYEQLLKDIVSEYEECGDKELIQKKEKIQLVDSIISNQNNFMETFLNPASKKIYAVGNDGKKHWIFNEESFTAGKNMGLWKENLYEVKSQSDNSYEEGDVLIFVKV